MFDIFISYKRKSLATANNLYYRLCTKGYSTFFDLEEMGRDNFNTQLLTYIEHAKDVFVLLEEGSLDACLLDKNPEDIIVLEDGTRERKSWTSDWFCREIAHAIEQKKNIIPVLINGCTMPKADSLPKALKELSLKHAPEFSFSFFDDYINKLIEKGFITSTPQGGDRVTSIFKFYSNMDCTVYKEGKLVCQLAANSDEPFYLPVEHKGDYTFKSTNSKSKETVTIKEHIDAEEEKEVYIKWKRKTKLTGLILVGGVLGLAFLFYQFVWPYLSDDHTETGLPSGAVETQNTEVFSSDKTADENGQTENTTGTAEGTDEKTGHAAICITELPLGEKPGEADLNSIGSVIKYPDDKDYLDEYRYAVVSAPSGHSIYSFGSAAHDGTPQTLLNNEEVLILAEHKGYSCVIVLSQKKARWVNTEYLTINEKCLILREKPCAEDLNTVDPGVSHPDTNEFLDAYEQKHVKTNQDLSGISCMRILAEGEKEGNYFKVEDGTEIVVLARNRYEFSCVLIPSMNAAGWIESRYLA